MISLKLADTKAFMSHLLIKDTFDFMLLSKAELSMAYSFTLDGSVNRGFFTDEELEDIKDDRFTQWSVVKPFCFSFIKGSRVPTGMKIIFVMPKDIVEDIVSESGATLSSTDVDGLFVNVRYKDGAVTVVTGTSLKTFSLEKSIDAAFDRYVRALLEQFDIAYDEL